MLWVLKRIVLMRRFFCAPKTYIKIHGKENIYNFTLKNFVYLATLSLLYLQQILYASQLSSCQYISVVHRGYDAMKKSQRFIEGLLENVNI